MDRGLQHLMLSIFASPRPVPITESSPVRPEVALGQLREAVEARRYSTPGRFSPGFFRLGGDATSDAIHVSAKPYVIPGLRAGYGAMTLEFHGQVLGIGEGSEIRGTVFAPVGRATVWTLAISLVAWVALNLVGNGSTLVGWTFALMGAGLLAAAWAWVIRRNQRMALRNADEFARLLGSIVSAEPR